ncbi:hypothetical protein ACOME3_007151 [Neoechinorhynchus agilis]
MDNSSDPVIHNDDDSPPEQKRRNTENGGGTDDFLCNICLDIAHEAVVSFCGHMFCWPCLSQWFDTRPNNQTCPVCKNPLTSEKVVPIYGKNSDRVDPRTVTRPRPSAQRSTNSGVAHHRRDNGFLVDAAGFQMSFGIGAFPIGLFSTTFNFGRNTGEQESNRADRNVGFAGLFGPDDNTTASRIYFLLAIIIITWILLF